MYNLDEKKIKKIIAELKNLTVTHSEAINDFKFISSGYKKENTPPLPDDTWETLPSDSVLGGIDEHYWMYATIKTPAAPDADSKIYFDLRTGREGQWDAKNPQCLIYIDNIPKQGLDTNHTDYELEFDREYALHIYMYSGMEGGNYSFIPSLKIKNSEVEALYYDIKIPYESLACLDKNSDEYAVIFKHLLMACNILDMREYESECFYNSVKAAREFLKTEFYGNVCGNSTSTVTCIGHTHIDVAWLWTLSQTEEKVQRSFATVLELMKKYPDFVFMSSQPQLYKYVRKYAPELYEQIKERVKEGRFEPEGAMWLEADCNLSSGESLVRQIMFGKRFFKEEFDIDSKVLWLPDVFGYSAAMPQILQKTGVDKFVTSKISWNEFNTMPYDIFMWEGIDGSKIFTSFMTAQEYNYNKIERGSTYVAKITPQYVMGARKRLQQKQYTNSAYLTFGYGDGGGGPTREMLENHARLKYGIPGMPKTVIEPIGNYLDRLKDEFDKSCAELRKVPTWCGELYLEFHRGTYTSIAKNKKNNRKSEFLFQSAEQTASLANIKCGKEYPQSDINDSWETILLNQFHDIIPGSSIKKVYDESRQQYAKIRETGENIIASSLNTVAANVKSSGTLVYNPNSFEVSAPVVIGTKTVLAENIPAMGYKVISEFNDKNNAEVTPSLIENRYYKITLDNNGNITSIYDKEFDRDVTVPGKFANELEAFEDLPYEYDNWELSPYYKQKKWEITYADRITPFCDGIKSGLEIVHNFLNSTITQKLIVYDNSRRIDFETLIDWKESHIVLKTAFPLNVHSDKATYEIQFGSTERPTHLNTSFDAAKFEVCAQKYADISEYGYGAALLNDCKYGHNTERNVLKLTLLKCGTYPNPYADKEVHSFTYSLLPHGGDHREGQVVQNAYMLNRPLMTAKAPGGGNLPDTYSMLSCDKENIITETFKKAEDSDAYVLRAYDAYNCKSKATFTFGFDIKSAYICDMLENKLEKLNVIDNKITVPFSNFEIVTVMVER